MDRLELLLKDFKAFQDFWRLEKNKLKYNNQQIKIKC